jgi:hypothetical protein
VPFKSIPFSLEMATATGSHRPSTEEPTEICCADAQALIAQATTKASSEGREILQ